MKVPRWVPGTGRGVQVIGTEVPHGVVPPSASMGRVDERPRITDVGATIPPAPKAVALVAGLNVTRQDKPPPPPPPPDRPTRCTCNRCPDCGGIR